MGEEGISADGEVSAEAGEASADVTGVQDKCSKWCAAIAEKTAKYLSSLPIPNRFIAMIALPNSEVLLHQVMGGVEGQAVEVEITARHMLKLRDRLNQILVKHTGQSLGKIEKDTDRDFFMTGEEAKKYGIVDKIVKVK